MNGENDEKNNDFSSKFRMQIDLQQTEEALRKIRSEIINSEIQIRKYRQEFTRAKMNLDSEEEKFKQLKNRQFELEQTAVAQKRVYIAKK